MKTIDWTKWSAIAELTGVVAVVVTLLYLADQTKELRLQTEQNNKQLALQSYQAWASNNLQIDMAMAEPAHASIIAAGSSDSKLLSKDTSVEFGQLHMAYMQMAQESYYLYRAGALDEDLWKAEMSRAAGILAAPGVRQWWDAGAKTQLTPSFVRFLESARTSIGWWDWNAEKGYFRNDAKMQSRKGESDKPTQ